MQEYDSQDITPQVQSNAAVSYFFMGLFMLVSRNPRFAHPFIRAHAKYASVFHAAIVFTLLLMLTLFSTRGERTLPSFEILDIKISHIIFTLVLIVCFFGLMHGLHRAAHARYPSLAFIQKKLGFSPGENTTQTFQGGLDETQSMMVVSSYVPYLGIIVSAHHGEKDEVVFGARIGSVVMLVIIAIGLMSQPGQYTIPILILMIYTVAVCFRAVMIFFQHADTRVQVYVSIPSWEVVYSAIRSLPKYFIQVLHAAGGADHKLDFRNLIMRSQIDESKREDDYQKKHPNKQILFSPYIAYIPFLNLVYIPVLLRVKDSIYGLAIKQGLMLTLAIVILWGQSLSVWWGWIVLFPLCLGLSMVKKRPAYRVVAAYELLAILSWVVRFFPTKKSVDTIQKSEDTPTKEKTIQESIQNL